MAGSEPVIETVRPWRSPRVVTYQERLARKENRDRLCQTLLLNVAYCQAVGSDYSQVYRPGLLGASPRLCRPTAKMFRAAFRSRSSTRPHEPH